MNSTIIFLSTFGVQKHFETTLIGKYLRDQDMKRFLWNMSHLFPIVERPLKCHLRADDALSQNILEIVHSKTILPFRTRKKLREKQEGYPLYVRTSFDVEAGNFVKRKAKKDGTLVGKSLRKRAE